MPRSKRIDLRITDDTFKTLQKEAKENGYSGVGAYILVLAGIKNEDKYDQLATEAFKRMLQLPPGAKFTLGSLFKDWSTFPLALRRKAGPLFAARIRGSVTGVKMSYVGTKIFYEKPNAEDKV